jgi:hypothetical protein
MEPLLDSAAAAQWLTVHGVRRTPATLRKLRCIGGGPKFRRLNRKPYYTERGLAAWIESRLGAPVGSTSRQTQHDRDRDRRGARLRHESAVSRATTARK